MSLTTDIRKYERQLVNKAAKKGLYENFGQDEVRKLKDKHIDSSDYTDEMNKKRAQIQRFNEWCMSYDGSGYGLGGTLLTAAAAGYVGYKVGRARPQKTGFSTEKKIAAQVKKEIKEMQKKRAQKKRAKSNIVDVEFEEIKARGGTISIEQLDRGIEYDMSNFEHKLLPNRAIRESKNKDSYELYDYNTGEVDYSYRDLDDLLRHTNRLFKRNDSAYAKGGKIYDVEFDMREREFGHGEEQGHRGGYDYGELRSEKTRVRADNEKEARLKAGQELDLYNRSYNITNVSEFAKGGEVSDKEYVDYLNEVGEMYDYESEEWIIGGKNRVEEYWGRYGEALKDHDPIAFEVGRSDYERERDYAKGGKTGTLEDIIKQNQDKLKHYDYLRFEKGIKTPNKKIREAQMNIMEAQDLLRTGELSVPTFEDADYWKENKGDFADYMEIDETEVDDDYIDRHFAKGGIVYEVVGEIPNEEGAIMETFTDGDKAVEFADREWFESEGGEWSVSAIYPDGGTAEIWYNGDYFAKGGNIEDYSYDYADIGQFSMDREAWSDFTDKQFEKIGKDIVEVDYDGNIEKAYESIVRQKFEGSYAKGGKVDKLIDMELERQNLLRDYPMGEKDDEAEKLRDRVEKGVEKLTPKQKQEFFDEAENMAFSKGGKVGRYTSDDMPKFLENIFGKEYIDNVLIQKDQMDINFKDDGFFVGNRDIKAVEKKGWTFDSLSTYGTSGISLLFTRKS